jgi:hypothetical protein
MYRELAFHIAGVSDLRGLEEQHLDFLIRNRTMFHAARNDREVALVQRDALVAEVYPESSMQNQEKLIFPSVVVPDEFRLET